MGLNKEWRNKHNSVWQAQKLRYYSKHAKQDYCSYHRYTQDDRDLILSKGIPDVELCVRLGRTLRAIQIYRSRLLKEGVNHARD